MLSIHEMHQKYTAQVSCEATISQNGPDSEIGYGWPGSHNLRALVPVHNLSYEVLNSTIEFSMFELDSIPIFTVNGSDKSFFFFSSSYEIS